MDEPGVYVAYDVEPPIPLINGGHEVDYDGYNDDVEQMLENVLTILTIKIGVTGKYILRIQKGELIIKFCRQYKPSRTIVLKELKYAERENGKCDNFHDMNEDKRKLISELLIEEKNLFLDKNVYNTNNNTKEMIDFIHAIVIRLKLCPEYMNEE